MKRRHNLRSIRDKRSYSFRELAETLGVHIRTIQTWHHAGLPIIEGTAYPFLVVGSDSKQFLKKFSQSKKTKLGKGQCYCVACHKAIDPIEPEIRSNNRRIGKEKESVSIVGKCPDCRRVVSRFHSREISKSNPEKPSRLSDDPFMDLPLFSQF